MTLGESSASVKTEHEAQKVYLSGNEITTIEQGTFIDLPALEYIYLSGNRIAILQQGTFEDLPALVYIELDSSRITLIQNGAFKNLPALKYLGLNNSKITTIHSGAFENLRVLKSLYLSDQNITTVHSGAFKDLPGLISLYLSSNRITIIQQGTFEDLPALGELDGNRITVIQSGAFKDLPALKNLFIRGNRINVIQQGTFEDLPALQTIALNSNTVTTIQTGAFKDLPALNNIDLSGSNLKFARNDTFAYITNLHSLHLGLFCNCNVPFWSWLRTKSFTNENVYCLDRNHVQLSSLNASDFDNCTYNACQYTDYCSNGGSCSQNSFGDLSCSCVVEWIGATCTESANHCVANVDNFHTNWRKTAESTLATLECTGEYTGNASRYCSSDGKWQEPNYSNCTSNSIEHIKEQTAKLLSGDNITDPVTIILDDLENITRDNNELRSGDLLTSSTVLNDIAKYVTNHTEDLSVDQLEIFGSLCDNLLDERNHHSWEELNNEGLGGVTSLVNAVTEYSNAYNDVIDGESSLVVAKENVVMQVGKASSVEITVPDRIKTSDSWISDSATEIKLKKNICSGLTGYSSTFYRNISRFFPKYIILNGNIKPFNGSYGVNSIIADFTIHGTTCSDYSLIIKFEHLLENYSKPFCGHWDFSAPKTVNGAWSTFGSQVVDATDSYTICEYNHTTNFAILMSPGRPPSSHHFPLSLISAIGCGVSILFLIITILIHFILWRYVKTDRTKTLMNLCVALIMSYVIFLAGITQTENKVVCSAIAIALHYIFLTDFALMLAEGILIVRMVVFVFPASSIIHKLIPACWIIPAGIVGVTAAVTKLKGYGNQQFCWLTLESNLIWAFIGPALLVILINFMFIIITVYKMMTSRGLAAKTLQVKFKIGLKSICVILPLFGLTWVLGAFSINDDLVMFQYLFATFNSLQGFFICLFHCILNEQVRLGYRHFQRRRHAYRMDSKLPTESTNTDNSKTHRLNDNFREKKKQMKEN
ncbi:brain-specific angiogenesis inhibitor 3 [Mytilus galloprovincialis]|uniref:Brain-specific angiogenesis inhibitor 3 n=1 Tax=Mytilus galloprovincialis TaxID=29158 RepID=A0A8B6CLJ8_MYTGA|nr:brain-specific angiogenesis inhibitor 3 [Mytilus galloprovincialis]